MRRRLLTPIFSTLVALGALGACDTAVTEPEAEAAAEARAASALLLPIPIGGSHPWVGRQVRLRDWTGDSYDRCLGPQGLPANNVRLNAELCYGRGLDTLQWFTVTGVVTGPGPIAGVDPRRVSLRSVYNPNFCVDVAAGTANGNEAFQLFACHSGSNQLFHLPLPGTGTSTTATGAVLTKNSNYTMALEADAPNSLGTVKPTWQRLYSATRSYQRWTLQVR
jgi:hypothetical protein